MNSAPPRKSTKSWSYDALTKATEEQIISLLKVDKNDSPEMLSFNRNAAIGAYLLWENVTMGWQNDGDAERLDALMQSKREPTGPVTEGQLVL